MYLCQWIAWTAQGEKNATAKVRASCPNKVEGSYICTPCGGRKYWCGTRNNHGRGTTYCSDNFRSVQLLQGATVFHYQYSCCMYQGY